MIVKPLSTNPTKCSNTQANCTERPKWKTKGKKFL